MRQGSNSRRPRSRGDGRRHSSPRGNNVESNGPDVKVRGTAQQVLEKYLSLAQDAFSSGDRLNAESYYQHADHYYRMINGDSGSAPQNGQGRGNSKAPAVQPPQAAPETPAAPEASVVPETPAVSEATTAPETPAAREDQASPATDTVTESPPTDPKSEPASA